MQDEQGGGEVGDEGPVGAGRAPLPEVVGALGGGGGGGRLEGEVGRGRSVREGDVQEEEVYADHKEGLDEERGAEAGAEPVVDSVVRTR